MKKIIKASVLLASTFCISNVFSGSMGNFTTGNYVDHRLNWAVNVASGYAHFHYDGDAVPARISISKELAKKNNYVVGLELGVQQFWSTDDGRTFRFADHRRRGGNFRNLNVPRVEMNPLVDLLATGQLNWADTKVFFLAKAGIVLRNWDLRDPTQPRQRSSNRSDFAYEGQLGVGYHVTDSISVTVAYQGIVRSNIIVGRHSGTLRNDLPMSNAVLAGISVNI